MSFDRIHNMSGKNQGRMPKKYAALGLQYNENRIKRELRDQYEGVMIQYVAMREYLLCAREQLAHEEDEIGKSMREGERLDAGEESELARLQEAGREIRRTEFELRAMQSNARELKDRAYGLRSRKHLESRLRNFRQTVQGIYRDCDTKLKNIAINIRPEVHKKKPQGKSKRARRARDAIEEENKVAKAAEKHALEAEYGRPALWRRWHSFMQKPLHAALVLLNLGILGAPAFEKAPSPIEPGISMVQQINSEQHKASWEELMKGMKEILGGFKHKSKPPGFYSIPLSKRVEINQVRKELGVDRKHGVLWIGRERFEYA